VLLEFGRKVKDRILEARQGALIARRLWLAGVGLTAALALLAVLYGYLKIDLATAGGYRGRLRLAAATAILGVAAAVMLLA
jgi:hypothetical protein